ncbi:hypothetical protein D5086_031433 [Populus alba]|uniref:Uncharacterized protein n=1 Tax=Populus alba TaxID=43335 RepID=A0ACC4AIL6_POPAL
MYLHPRQRSLLCIGWKWILLVSHICKEAVDRGLTVASLSRSGRPLIHDSWVSNVIWHQGSLLSSYSWTEALNGVTSVLISCVGGFGSQSYMYKINGTANINAIRVCFRKRKAAETELLTKVCIRRVRLVAVATQKFVADVATDALQQCKARPAPVVKDKRDKAAKGKAPNFDNGGSVEGTE